MASPRLRTVARSILVSGAVVALAGCGTASTNATVTPPASSAPPSQAPSQAPSPTPTTATPTPSPTAAPTPTLITFPGDGVSVNISNVQTTLKATSPAFRTFIAAQLHKLWATHGSLPGCQGSALIALTAYRSDGFANASDEGMFGSASCASGGNSALYAQVNGVWQEILGTQSGYDCTDLMKYHVPSSVAGPSCMNSAGNPQPYTG